jgi:hypothetical protein
LSYFNRNWNVSTNVNTLLKYKIFASKRDEMTGSWRKLHNEELHNLYSSPGGWHGSEGKYIRPIGRAIREE